MDVKEFFYNGGVVKCKDRTESDVVIEIAVQEGISPSVCHDPRGQFHGVTYNADTHRMDFYSVGSPLWCKGTPFDEWMATYAGQSSASVEDLI